MFGGDTSGGTGISGISRAARAIPASLEAGDDVVSAEMIDGVHAALAAGGTLVTERWAKAFLADPGGYEACICTRQDRD